MSDALLLDTCALIWIMEDEPLAGEAEQTVHGAAERGAVFVSPISAWEVGLLQAKGRMAFVRDVEDWFAEALRTPGFRLAELPVSVLVRSTTLPARPPPDPADRIIIATGRAHGWSIVTRDRTILAYASEGYVSAMAC